MRKIIFLILPLALIMTAVSCSREHFDNTEPASTGVTPQAQLDALKKAKSVENVLMQGEQQRREQSEAAQ